MKKQLFLFYNSLSIAGKLKFMGFSSAFIAGSILLVLVYVFQYLSERDIIVKESRVFANILADNIAPAIIIKDVLSVSNILASIEYNDKITQTFALDNSWKILGAFHKGNDFVHQRKTIPLIRENQNLWKAGYFYSVVPIVKDEVELGHLVVVASLEEFYTRMLQHSFILIFIIFFAVYITTRFREILQESILQPIAKLDEITTQIIKTKNLNYEIPVFNNDEIGDLAKNFKHMIIELNEQKDTLSYQANYDSLTKLPNRAYFYQSLEESIYKSKRYNEKFALFFIDLDQFKEVNDTYGHEHGDKLLQKVSIRLSSLLRLNDVLARLGGDEFVIIMNNIKEFDSASVLSQKILDILEIPIEVDGEQLFISCSIGISLCPQDSIDAKELIKNADIAMFRSKNNGRKTYNFYAQEMTDEVVKRIQMQSKIRYALENREFIVHYQAQHNMISGEIIGLEALVRWQRGDEILYPDSFISYTEEFGMVVAMNRQVMRQAMLQAKIFYDKGLFFGRISINISIEQIEDENFIGFVVNLLSQSECKAEWIALELTEWQIMKNTQTAIRTLNELSKIGIEIVIDDFGTGYSSLSYLKNLPIDKLKIDRSFIMDIPNDKDDMAIVSAIIAIAKSLGIDFIAEGVETQAQKEFLISQECYNVQGFLFARALSVEKLTQILVKAS